ncbi:MAG: GNAT family N-acetyltransferase [Pelagibacterium sp. SCN 64-44]|nr:MAG: GNAT family N-acetyltransferase [Pelagibacterium sp. SCN 64-44]
MLLWRPLLPSDLPALSAIAAQVHPGFPEDDAVFAERQRLCPGGTMLLEKNGAPAGYMLSHPWRFGQLPALNALLGEIPRNADTYYLHDLALLPAARGSGAAGMAVEKLLDTARTAGFAHVSLVAVNGSQPFWRRHGFAVEERPELAGKLASYEAAARLMVHRFALVKAGGAA